MKTDIQKFADLFRTDETFRNKLKEAMDAYTGERTEEAVFNNVLDPVAKEYGISATFDDYKDYIEQLGNQEMNKDELTQVAGGKISGGGIGAFDCTVIGLGAGAGGGSGSFGFCVILGAGEGMAACFTVGAADDGV